MEETCKIHVFFTLGRSRMPAHVLASWTNRFFVCHTDEDYQVLLAFGFFILCFLRHDGRMLFRDDHGQFAGMRTFMAVPSPYRRISELMFFYKPQQQIPADRLPERDDSVSVDSAQGSVILTPNILPTVCNVDG